MPLHKCGLSLNEENRELTPHGSLEFPAAAYGKEYSVVAGQLVPWHWHEEIEVIYMKQGSAKVQVPGKMYQISEGDSIFLNGDVLHEVRPEPFCNISSVVFHKRLIEGAEDSVFCKKYVEPVLRSPELRAHVFSTKEPWQRKTTENIKKAWMYLADGRTGYEFFVRSELSQVFLKLFQQYRTQLEENKKEDTDTLRFQKMLRYMEQHYEEKIDLSQVAAAADIGERECLRCFQRNMKISPMQYLMKYRIAKGAAILIADKQVSISQAAIRCGFESPSYFSQMFKRYFKCTPKQYRNDS